MDSSYDVVVVGAGPGGSAVAKKCAESGFKVLMLEKKQEIGSPKRCAEGLTFSTEKLLGEIDKRCVAQTIKGAVVYAPNGNAVDIDFGDHGGYVLERKVFDKWLAYRASKAGVYVQAKTEVKDVIKKNDYIKGVVVEFEGEEKEVKSKIVVAADGVESIISRKAGLDTTNQLINVDSGFQYEMSNLKLNNNENIEIYMGNEIAPRGYVWIFPKGDHIANVGIGIGMANKTAKYYLDKFIEKNPKIFKNSSIIEVNSGGIPVGGFLNNMVLNGFIAVGDAAHQVNPIHGGGLKEATIAGQIAGDVIIKALKDNDFSKDNLSEYNNIWWSKRGLALEKVQRLREVVEKLSDDDFNYLSKVLDGEDIVEFTRGKKLLKLGRILIKKPRLLKIAKKLF